MPLAFHVLLDTTFLDSSVFERCIVGVSSILANLKSRFQSVCQIHRRYHWGCNWSLSLPIARILPKPSKDFRKARPIIACDRGWHARLTTFLATGLFQIMSVIFPPGSTFNVQSVQQAIRAMWRSMMNYSATEPVVMVQQDLIGFFKFCASFSHTSGPRFHFDFTSGQVGSTMAEATRTGIFTQQGPTPSGVPRTAQVCSSSDQDLTLGRPPDFGRVSVTIQFLSMWPFHISTDTRRQHGICSCSCSVYSRGFYHGVHLVAQFSCFCA